MTKNTNSEQDLINEILPNISETEHEKLKKILGPDFESWSSVKESFINNWKSGDTKLVKVVALEDDLQEKVGGYFTEERWIKGFTPEEMEPRLGFAKGKLKNGASIYELSDIPDKNQFEVKGYTHLLPKDELGHREDFVVGTGINQFRLNEPVPANVVAKVDYDQPWTGHSLGAKENVNSEIRNSKICIKIRNRNRSIGWRNRRQCDCWTNRRGGRQNCRRGCR